MIKPFKLLTLAIILVFFSSAELGAPKRLWNIDQYGILRTTKPIIKFDEVPKKGSSAKSDWEKNPDIIQVGEMLYVRTPEEYHKFKETPILGQLVNAGLPKWWAEGALYIEDNQQTDSPTTPPEANEILQRKYQAIKAKRDRLIKTITKLTDWKEYNSTKLEDLSLLMLEIAAAHAEALSLDLTDIPGKTLAELKKMLQERITQIRQKALTYEIEGANTKDPVKLLSKIKAYKNMESLTAIATALEAKVKKLRELKPDQVKIRAEIKIRDLAKLLSELEDKLITSDKKPANITDLTKEYKATRLELAALETALKQATGTTPDFSALDKWIKEKADRLEAKAKEYQAQANKLASWSWKQIVGFNVATIVLANVFENMLEGWAGAHIKGKDKRTAKQKARDAFRSLISLKMYKANFVQLGRVFAPAKPAEGKTTPSFGKRAVTFAKHKPFIAAGAGVFVAGNVYMAATGLTAKNFKAKYFPVKAA